MLIQDTMTKEPFCCRPEDSAAQAAQLFWEKDCGCAPIVDADGQLCGFVTDRDLCMAALFSDRKLSELRLADIACHPVHTCQPYQTLEEAEHLMRQAQVRRIVITDANARVVGLLSLNDIAMARMQKAPISAGDVANTLGDICARRPRAA